ncbi:2-keto-4-pentenoate hydratase [Acinetobacter sp. YH12136]|uniref:2-keto-4-pentenoate hydratase n=1 Tax=Acinetobacter sp. YH12136 TaxID=2601120 RepID=UPI0015D1A289|nr:fumarylacetoacetate hydrolase family protein [Acinetobacter sp. YH12136]
MNIQTCAEQLHQTRLNKKEISSLRTNFLFDLEQAYQIQEYGLHLREQQGEKSIGVKLGFTSKAKMLQMGVNHLIWGGLTDAMQVQDGGSINLNDFIHPRIEPEIGFLTKKDINLTLNMTNCLDYIEGVFPALEIIDSRYQAFKFSLEDVVADNTSSAAFVMGQLYPTDHFESNMGVLLKQDGHIIESGTTAAILGNPLQALIQISELLQQRGKILPAGSIILAGAATAAIPLHSGHHYQAEINGLGSVSVSVN